MKYDSTDKEILKMLQRDIIISERPFQELSDQLNITEEEIVRRIAVMQEKGIIRRLGAVLRHQKAGYKVNAMVAWKVNPLYADEPAQKLAEYNEISHCYLRKPPDNFDYPLFAMIHSRTEKQMEDLLKDISQNTGLLDFVILKSKQELKKTSMEYF